jgi:3-methyladenine DNA glycosylase AlkD
MIDDPDRFTGKQKDEWLWGFNSWDICDQCCGNLFSKTKYAFKKAMEWSERKEEFVKRAGYVLMATVSIHDKNTDNIEFIKFLPIIKNNSTDDRNFVKKAVNWALRQVGKRNCILNKKAIETANEILQINTKSAKWIASNAIRDLTNPATQNRVNDIKNRI